MRYHRHPLIVIATLFMAAWVLFSFSGYAQSHPPAVDMPKQLLPWKDWVLYGNEKVYCPSRYNNAEKKECVWPSQLNIDTQTDGGHFEYTLFVYIKSWIPLPGGDRAWPQNVTVNGKPTPTTLKNKAPFIILEKGEHLVKGDFIWKTQPEMLQLPTYVGLFTLTIDGKKIFSPNLDDSGKLWLKETRREKREEDRETIQIFRKVKDSIPMEITSHIILNVAGSIREIQLDHAFLDNTTPMKLESPLPLRYDEENILWVQARPGKFNLSVTARFNEPILNINQPLDALDDEIWSFQAQNHLRMVKIGGISTVEPSRTDMPQQWKQYPAYLVKPGDILTFEELKRGDKDPAPDRLSLTRNYWLDFDGKGLTIHDKITGTMEREWHLSMKPPITLGRVSVSGTDQLITAQGEKKLPGVQLRHGNVILLADARLAPFKGELPAVGWDHDFESVSNILKIPPGYRLFSAWGVDKVSDTWLSKWSLLDLFLVLIISLGIFKLKNRKWGIIALFTLPLIYHEPFAPRMVFLHLLIVMAIYPLLKKGWLQKAVTVWGVIAGIVLFIQVIPFMVHQIRLGIYPQLEEAPTNTVLTAGGPYEETFSPKSSRSMDYAKEYAQKKLGKAEIAGLRQERRRGLSRQKAISAQDPNALVQTGPGLPTWRWKASRLTFNGPVTRDQKITLILIPPKLNLFLSILRATLLAFLILGFLDIKTVREKLMSNLKPLSTVASMIMVLFFITEAGAQEISGSYPPKFILEELKEKLLQNDPCFPNCADIPRMELSIDSNSLNIFMEIHTFTETAIPLPCSENTFIPHTILIKQLPLKKVMKDSAGNLWALVPKGVHPLTLIGNVEDKNELQIPLPLLPRYTIYQNKGWTVKGIHENGKTDSGIQLIREKKEKSHTGNDKKRQSISPYFHITREIHLGINWRVDRVVSRMTPPGIQTTLLVPLMEGESVTTPGIHVENGFAQVHFKPDEKTIQFFSTLKQANALNLSAPQDVNWTETWRLDISPIWSCQFAGIPEIHHQNKEGIWQPEWKPWPGEKLNISIERPAAIPGVVTTIDSATLKVTPGQRINNVNLFTTIRTSRGIQHTFTLPENATLQKVTVDDASLPIQQKGQTLTVPLKPGKQQIGIEFHQPNDNGIYFKGPIVKIGQEAVNATVSFHLPGNKWILMVGGPRLGPCVLFWSYLVVVMIFAWMLGKVPLTPLNTVSWMLLALGLTQIAPISAIIVVGWFIAIGLRERYTPPSGWFKFNITQLLLILLTLMAFSALYEAIERGLLGLPNMQIHGNNSSNTELIWTKDRIGETMPQPFVLYLPLWTFHGVMLAWALWLSFSMLKWLKWAYSSFSHNGAFQKMPERKIARKRKERKNKESSEK